MSHKELAHDLALVKLAGSQLAPDELVTEYEKIFAEIINYLDSLPQEPVFSFD